MPDFLIQQYFPLEGVENVPRDMAATTIGMQYTSWDRGMLMLLIGLESFDLYNALLKVME